MRQNTIRCCFDGIFYSINRSFKNVRVLYIMILFSSAHCFYIRKTKKLMLFVWQRETDLQMVRKEIERTKEIFKPHMQFVQQFFLYFYV